VSSRCFDHGLATAVGMTFQVSEITRTTHAIRSTAFRHALLSHLLGGCLSVTSVDDRIGPEAAGSSRLDPTRRAGPTWCGRTSRRRGRVISDFYLQTARHRPRLPCHIGDRATLRGLLQMDRAGCVFKPRRSPRIPQGDARHDAPAV